MGMPAADEVAMKRNRGVRATHTYQGRSRLGDINHPDTVPKLPGQPGFPGPPGRGERGEPRPRPQPPDGVDHGALVGQVAPSGPAARASVQTGDVITSFDGVDIYNPTSYSSGW
jgi:hypothetical protein